MTISVVPYKVRHLTYHKTCWWMRCQTVDTVCKREGSYSRRHWTQRKFDDNRHCVSRGPRHSQLRLAIQHKQSDREHGLDWRPMEVDCPLEQSFIDKPTGALLLSFLSLIPTLPSFTSLLIDLSYRAVCVSPDLAGSLQCKAWNGGHPRRGRFSTSTSYSLATDIFLWMPSHGNWPLLILTCNFL